MQTVLDRNRCRPRRSIRDRYDAFGNLASVVTGTVDVDGSGSHFNPRRKTSYTHDRGGRVLTSMQVYPVTDVPIGIPGTATVYDAFGQVTSLAELVVSTSAEN
jgi:hypothetical protein